MNSLCIIHAKAIFSYVIRISEFYFKHIASPMSQYFVSVLKDYCFLFIYSIIKDIHFGEYVSQELQYLNP